MRSPIVEFDWIVTAQQARGYKPATNNFRVAFEQIGVPTERLLHVAQSLFHDHVPARLLGLDTVWVNRRHGRPGSEATPPASAQPTLLVLRFLGGRLRIDLYAADGILHHEARTTESTG